MIVQVVTITVQELLDVINNEREIAYAAGYIKAKKELEEEAAKVVPKFNEILRGAKELRAYLEFKG